MNKYALNETVSGEKAFRSNDRLTADEEKELSKRILSGEAAKAALSGIGRLSGDERSALERSAEEGERAYETLVLANLPRASKIAWETFRMNPDGLNELEDYRQTAMKVICVCARTFDWKLGCRFSTYVHRSLMHEMMRENARMGYAMRIPEENLARLGELRRESEKFGVDTAARNLEMTGESAARLLLACSYAKSLQDPVNTDDPDIELGDTIADARAVTAEEIEARIDQEELLKKLRIAFSALPDDERSLLEGRMGLRGEPLPMRAFVGIAAGSISGVQKKQIAAEKHLREIFFSLPMAD